VADPRVRAGPVPGLLGRALERVYAAGLARRSRRFDQGLGVERLPRPVVSIGNLSVGGTGKTPMVAYLCRALLRTGFAPAIAMRGYAQRAGTPSDEADEYARLLPGVPVVAQPNRAAGLRALLKTNPGIDIILLDDGFQHRQLARDLDIVLIDCARPPTRDRLLPAGWLREPTSALIRASMLVLTRAEQVTSAELAELLRDLKCCAVQADIAVTRHAWTGLRSSACTADLPLDAIYGARVVGCCAIGHSGAFLRSLALASGAPLAGELALPDHDPFGPYTVGRLIALAKHAQAEWIVVTEKDWSKLRHVDAARWPCPVLRPVLELTFDPEPSHGQDRLEHAVLSLVIPGRSR
jgi:tetraacyldisaccharide 4'-kinase